MKKEEVRVDKNSPELMLRRWNDDRFAEEDPISPDNVRETKKAGGIEDEVEG
jgi:hypothetical protein